MKMHWTFRQKIAAGFAAVVVFALISNLIAIRALREVFADEERVIAGDAVNLTTAAKLQGAIEHEVAAFRGYILTPNAAQAGRMKEADDDVAQELRALEAHNLGGESGSRLSRIRQAEQEFSTASDPLVQMRESGQSIESLVARYEQDVVPKRLALSSMIDEFVTLSEKNLEAARAAASTKADQAVRMVIWIMIGCVGLALVLAFFLSRQLGRDLGSAVQHINSASAELQAAANQQTTGARETATSMNEISTTVSELLATSRQIAESSQRVAQISHEATGAARNGDKNVREAQESIAGIKRQVDQVVGHMLDLGKKSQQIGGVVDIINELAEQTNILSINASIEAAGAGETGRRFAVVADEIRKLAERVGGSTREITGLIEEIRAAVNTAVMATEGSAKAVEAGTRQYGQVTASFADVMRLVATSTDATREIELSTKQQMTAVEQVNTAIVNTAQATKEAEASSGQTLQTAGQLTTLSSGLAQLV
ncbi:MAG TPA: methyl-accepting chemotaxis protein [Phycisphaerae bacterium]|nr:methyl-accepting chemotaxis protein [Phycisphaerae bacterium]